jgi:hypothetical protein
MAKIRAARTGAAPGPGPPVARGTCPKVMNTLSNLLRPGAAHEVGRHGDAANPGLFPDTGSLDAPPGPPAEPFACDLVAWAFARATEAELRALRRSPGTLGGAPPAAGLLKQADEQSVIGLAAVLRAVADGGLDPSGFARWGVVSAPRLLGLSAFRAAFPQFLAEGAWGVAPLLVSSHSLHSPSGVISQALGAHGPNLGAGGAPGSEAQAFLAASALLDGPSADGVWVVLTGSEPGAPGPDGGAPITFEAVALALTPARPGWPGRRLLVGPGWVDVVDAGRASRWRPSGPHFRVGVPAGAEAGHAG